MSGDQKRIVVVGAGFGGLTFCQHFEHPNASLTLLDRTNHHLFQPLLYQVAMAGLSAPDIAQPIRSILSPKPRLEVRMEEVTGFDLNTRQVVTQTHRHSYDYLVLAFGGVTGYFGHPEWEEYAPGLKTLEDALLIRRNVLLAFERAETAASPLEQERLTTIVVVGGGPTGVELAGACAELAHRVLKRDFDHLDPTRSRIILIEALPRILSQFPEDLSKKAESQLRKLGVQVRTSCAVKSISQGKITLANDEAILAENILWGAGVMARPLTKQLGVDLDKAGRVMVNPDLSLPGHPEVFAIGDIASVRQQTGKPVPGVAPAAMQMARHAARLIRDEIECCSSGGERRTFVYQDKGSLATIGRSAGIAQFGRIKLSGFIAWAGWLAVHLVFLIGFRNKLSVLVSWTYSYLTYRLGARIITGWPMPAACERPAPSSQRNKPLPAEITHSRMQTPR
jgi:NADH dehydrogenase